MRLPMGLSLVTPPAAEPLTLAEVAAHLRLDSTNVEPSPSVGGQYGWEWHGA